VATDSITFFKINAIFFILFIKKLLFYITSKAIYGKNKNLLPD
jgi:hypothetical protein